MYQLLRAYVRLGLAFYCPDVRFNQSALLKEKGPLVLASNHPNAILDAVILGSYFRNPVYFLSRGDVFSNPFVSRLLFALHLIPVYRLPEGKENIRRNIASFDKCDHLISKGGIILIFAEGSCENEWRLRPMKKGTARIALKAMREEGTGPPVRVLPVSLNYNSFDGPGKTVLVHFGDIISRGDLPPGKTEAEHIHIFNTLLEKQLSAGMLQSATDTKLIQSLINSPYEHSIPELKTIQEALTGEKDPEALEKLIPLERKGDFAAHSASEAFLYFMLFIPACLGWVLHAPLYFPVKKIIQRITKGTVYFDSVLFGTLLLLYPLYWILLMIIAGKQAKAGWLFWLILIMPLLAGLALRASKRGRLV